METSKILSLSRALQPKSIAYPQLTSDPGYQAEIPSLGAEHSFSRSAPVNSK